MIGEKTAGEIRESDLKRIEKLEAHHPVKIVHECETAQELRCDPEMREFVEMYEPCDILKCERALVGGRTEVFKLHENNGGKTLRYLDVVSLYPTVMKHESFPIGPPSNVNKDSISLPLWDRSQIEFEGFISCRILPPRSLALPLLPMKIGGKLMFSICLKCTNNLQQTPCRHSDEEKSFNKTFTTVEMKKALDLGYRVTKVYHAVKYDSWVKNDDKGERGLFTSYINQMMLEKVYSSGYPADVKTDEEKKAYCQGYLEKEHIELDDWSRFSKNVGKKAASKLMLNSLWGKFAQRVDMIMTVIITDPGKFWSLFDDKSNIIYDVRLVNDTLVIQYKKQAETLKSLKSGAIHIASLVTSYARLRLYSFMEKVGDENTIYADTDSIVYSIPHGRPDPLKGCEGPYLTQLTDELSGEMLEFVTIGPKSYCYREKREDGSIKVVRKSKGITINSMVDKKLTFELMKKMAKKAMNQVAQEARTMVLMPQQNVLRDADNRVFFRRVEKKFRYTFGKRRVLADGSTLPFGFC